MDSVFELPYVQQCRNIKNWGFIFLDRRLRPTQNCTSCFTRMTPSLSPAAHTTVPASPGAGEEPTACSNASGKDGYELHR